MSIRRRQEFGPQATLTTTASVVLAFKLKIEGRNRICTIRKNSIRQAMHRKTGISGAGGNSTRVGSCGTFYKQNLPCLGQLILQTVLAVITEGRTSCLDQVLFYVNWNNNLLVVTAGIRLFGKDRLAVNMNLLWYLLRNPFR